jgi:hypothetical protein
MLQTGGMNVIDLANINSCSFCLKIWAKNPNNSLGRFDNSDIRGCNLMVLKVDSVICLIG